MNATTIIMIVVAAVVALAAGLAAGFVLGEMHRKKTAEAQIGSYRYEADITGEGEVVSVSRDYRGF